MIESVSNRDFSLLGLQVYYSECKHLNKNNDMKIHDRSSFKFCQTISSSSHAASIKEVPSFC